MAKTQAVRGMNDVLPSETPIWQHLEECFARVVKSFGYSEIRFPVLEQTQLFKRSIGEVTDIVEKEMYSFEDRNGDNLSLRPEGTAGCVRAADQHGLLYNQQQRLWYQGAMFRHERPQKGRYRQFQQFGVETYGMAGPGIDVELMQLSSALWQELGISSHVRLELNNIGDAQERGEYTQALRKFFIDHKSGLDSEALRRLETNPLRILDSKNPSLQSILDNAPLLADFVSDKSKDHFDELLSLLDVAEIDYVINPKLVRGLDYYNSCVFEWVTDALGAQGTVCGGGRYDGLVEQLGGKSTFAAGFAMGAERLVLLLEELTNLRDQLSKRADVFILVRDEDCIGAAQALAKNLRFHLPSRSVVIHYGGGKVSSQLKGAIAAGAQFACILESEQLKDSSSLRLRKLDDVGESTDCFIADVPDKLIKCLL
jgi:histidyl-tRNA synthetase